jgi:tRNA threonylcarbamoyladenosine biosynthesis protein TsaB
VAPPAATRLAAIDARRGQVYAQAFLPDMTPVAGPRALDPAAALDDLPAGPVQVVGSGAALVRAAALDGRAITCEVIQPSAGAVARRAAARLAAGEAPLQGFALEPLYLRPPDARPPTPLVATAARVTMAAAGA